MIAISKLLTRLLIFAVAFSLRATEKACDTTKVFGDVRVTCIESNCPHDCTKVVYENGFLSTEYVYPGCSDSMAYVSFSEKGDTLGTSQKVGGNTVGIRKDWYPGNRPKRFTSFNDNGDKHGWDIFWYDNGNVKDSILFRNDSTMQRRSYYYNGKPQMFEDDIYGTYDAVSFNPKGKRTGKIKDGTGTVFLCDSVGGDCKELKYKGGKRIVE